VYWYLFSVCLVVCMQQAVQQVSVELQAVNVVWRHRSSSVGIVVSRSVDWANYCQCVSLHIVVFIICSDWLKLISRLTASHIGQFTAMSNGFFLSCHCLAVVDLTSTVLRYWRLIIVIVIIIINCITCLVLAVIPLLRVGKPG